MKKTLIRYRRWRLQRLANRFAKVCGEANDQLRALGMPRAERKRLFREISRGVSINLSEVL